MSHNIDWISRIQEAVDADHDTHVPPDITFMIEESGSTYEISAHKAVMGWASRVFNRMFFVADTKDKGAKQLLVKGTTKHAFQIMKDAIYNTNPIKDILLGKSVHEVFAVLDLVTRYEIPELELSVKDYIANFPLAEENLLEVAEDAMHYAGTFKDEAQALLFTCSKFLKPKFTDAQSVFKYIADNDDHNEVLLKLMALMKDPKCPNCQQDVCLNGREIQNNQFRVGLVVTNSEAADFWGCQASEMGKGLVTEVDGQIVKLEDNEGFPFDGMNGWHAMKYAEIHPLFLFCCK